MQLLKAVLSTCLSLLPLGAGQASQQIYYHASYLSDASIFTQGLECDPEGRLLISGGLYGESFIAYLDLEEGNLLHKQDLEEKYFAEGLTVTPQGVIQLTWKEETAFLRDPQTLEIKDTFSYEGEGWGLAYDADREILWLSDGSDQLQMRDPESFELTGTLAITYKGNKIEKLNELEYANGYLYANVWYDSQIYKIDPEQGHVVNTYDMAPILEEHMTLKEREAADVLNGIAHIAGDRFYITGKKYPYIFEVELIP